MRYMISDVLKSQVYQLDELDRSSSVREVSEDKHLN